MLKRINLTIAIDMFFNVTVIITLIGAVLSILFDDHEVIAKVLWATISGTLISALFSLYFSITEKDRKYFVIALMFLAGTVVNLIAMTKL